MKGLEKLRQANGDLSREQVCDIAAEKGIFIDAARLRRIEKEEYAIRPEEVIWLSDIYNEPLLCNHYCANECPIGKKYTAPINKKDFELEKIILSMVAVLNSIEKKQNRLIEITSDGEIDESEVEDFLDIKKILEKISDKVNALKFWTEKNDTSY